MGGGQMGDALAAALLYAVNIGVAYWLLVNLSGMATAAYQTFLQWGLAAGGGATAGLLLTPSRGRRYGLSDCRAAGGLCAPGRRAGPSSGTARRFSCITSPPSPLSVAFPLVALALMVTQIEYHLAVMLGAILIPFSIFGPTAFLAEFCIGWITGMSAAGARSPPCLSGSASRCFRPPYVALTPGGDPTNYSASIVALVSVLYVGLAWWVPNKAASMCGRVALGLTGSTVVAGAMGARARRPGGERRPYAGSSQMLKGGRHE